MSTILEKVKTAQKAYRKSAIKDKDATAKIKGGVLTTLIGEVETKATRSGVELTDAEVVSSMKKMVGGIEDLLELRHDDKLVIEIEALNAEIPQQASSEELEVEIASIVEGIEGPLSMKSMGVIMGSLKSTYGAKLDSAIASTIVKRIIAEST